MSKDETRGSNEGGQEVAAACGARCDGDDRLRRCAVGREWRDSPSVLGHQQDRERPWGARDESDARARRDDHGRLRGGRDGA